MLANQRDDPAWAWARYEPDENRPWDLRQAGHLYRRAAFGARWAELQQALADGPHPTIDRLLRPEADVAAFDRAQDEFETAAARSTSAEALRAWWLRRMIETPHPLLEKMTLFWHGHFAVSNARVQNAELMQSYLKLLRSQALGRFDVLLDAASRAPAVLVGLEGATNRRAQPNEHFARMFLEAFALGDGQCTEQDIREAARAFTGQSVLRGAYRFVQRDHDPGPKTVFGEEGPWKGSDVVRLALRQPAVPRRIVGKLYRWLIAESEPPGDALLEPLVDSFAGDYDIGKLVETMLRSNLFFSPAAYRQRVKGPVEFVLGIARGLEALVPTLPLGPHLAALGQDLLHPPTVEGWEGGRTWINSATLLGRTNLAAALLSGTNPYGDALDPQAVGAKHGRNTPAEAGPFLLELFVQGDVSEKVAALLLKPADGDAAQQLRRLAHAVVTLPEFQLA